MKAKHTPGPWEVSPGNDCRVNVARGVFLHPTEPRVAIGDEVGDDSFHDDWNIALTDGDMFSRDGQSECEANARLIAAAPAYALAWSLVPDEIRQRVFDSLHKPDTEWVAKAIEAV